MQHRDIIHANRVYVVSHLDQKFYNFVWTDHTGHRQTFRVFVRYSNHCYSRSCGRHALRRDDTIIEEHPELRVFCLERYGESFRLVDIVAEIITKPTTSVAQTDKGNYHVYSLSAADGSPGRYCIFFRLKNADVQPVDGSAHFLDLHIESAYLKDIRVGVRARMPFGKLASSVRARMRRT